MGQPARGPAYSTLVAPRWAASPLDRAEWAAAGASRAFSFLCFVLFLSINQ